MLSSIYSSYNNLKGKEYLLRLRSLLKNYKQKHSHDSINFELIHHLYSKIEMLRNSSFDEFPSMDHSSILSLDIEDEPQERPGLEKYRYKWITFYRNGSWFISRYDSHELKESDNENLQNYPDSGRIAFKGGEIDIVDHFSRFSPEDEKTPPYFLMVDYKNRITGYAVTKPGKRIYAEKNVIEPAIVPFTKSSSYRGRVRIFGKHHIFL